MSRSSLLRSAAILGCIASAASAQTPAKSSRVNPLTVPSTLPFQAPRFDQIKDTDYQPALEQGMPAHSAPLGLAFTKSELAGVGSGALVGIHGSWNRNPPGGYKVVRVRFENGQPVRVEDFVTGWLVNGGGAQWARVTGVAVAADGALLVADDGTARIGKLIVHARNRELALARLRRALSELVVDGIDTTTPLFDALLDEPDIQKGHYNIHWLERYLERSAAEE